MLLTEVHMAREKKTVLCTIFSLCPIARQKGWKLVYECRADPTALQLELMGLNSDSCQGAQWDGLKQELQLRQKLWELEVQGPLTSDSGRTKFSF